MKKTITTWFKLIQMDGQSLVIKNGDSYHWVRPAITADPKTLSVGDQICISKKTLEKYTAKPN